MVLLAGTDCQVHWKLADDVEKPRFVASKLAETFTVPVISDKLPEIEGSECDNVP